MQTKDYLEDIISGLNLSELQVLRTLTEAKIGEIERAVSRAKFDARAKTLRSHFEIGKAYMFNAAQAKKNKVEDLYSTIVQYYVPNDSGQLELKGRTTPHASIVMWVESDPYVAKVKDGTGAVRDTLVQVVKFCRPYDTFTITDFIFSVPGPLVFITKEMPPDGKAAFDEKYIKTTLTHVMNDLWD